METFRDLGEAAPEVAASAAALACSDQGDVTTDARPPSHPDPSS
ncbi:hypothetical protein WMF26_24465 [Sorangium sp. So ce185]